MTRFYLHFNELTLVAVLRTVEGAKNGSRGISWEVI